MYQDNLISILKKLNINYDIYNLIKINNNENKVICPYFNNFCISINDYYEDIFFEMVSLNLNLYIKKIDYINKNILFENTNSYKLILNTKNPNIYYINLISSEDNLSFYNNTIYADNTLILNEFFKLINYLKFLGTIKI